MMKEVHREEAKKAASQPSTEAHAAPAASSQAN
jgi:hypothetical protein